MNQVNCERQPVIFLPHMGVPLAPYAWQAITKSIAKYEMPDFILTVHPDWLSDMPTLVSSHDPKVIPINFVGEDPLPQLIARRLKARNIQCQIQPHHGTHGPTAEFIDLLYPNADIPIIQLSIKANGNAAEHLMLGEALTWLREEKVLIIGFGFPIFKEGVDDSGRPDTHKTRKSFLFDQWLNQIITQDIVTIPMRKTLLARWENAPHARYCHPSAATLLPLHLCCGAANFGAAQLLYDIEWDSMQLSAFLW